jgi:hypothetical protein
MSATANADRGEREHLVISRSLRKLLVPGPGYNLSFSGDPERPQVEAFIADKFRNHHGARVTAFLPALLSISCQGRYTAALGINPAASGALFLERYLDHPAEQVVAAIARTPVSRAGIVEIGNLVSSLGGSSALLYLILLAVIHRAGYHWVMFTATPEVQRGIGKLSFKIAPVCAADPARLDNPQQWGSYYRDRPQVMLGYIGESFQGCHDNLLLESVLELSADAIDQLTNKLGAL